MKHFSIPILAAVGLTLVGCSADDSAFNNGGYNDGKVTFSVEMPGNFNSRAIADGLSAKDLAYAVFDENGTFLFENAISNAFNEKIANVEIPLVNNKSYKVAFFAKNSAAPYSISNGVMTITYSDAVKANDDIYDAFYKVQNVEVNSGMPVQNVELKRPFAQVNVGATDWSAAKKAGYVVTETTLTYSANVYTTLNLVDGSVDNLQAVNFAINTLPDASGSGDAIVPASLKVADNNYDYMAMTYVLVPAERSLVNEAKFIYVGPKGEVEIPVSSLPVQRNYRTNIIGQFFTTNVNFNIVIDQEFDGDITYSTDYTTLAAAIANGGNIVLANDIALPASLIVPAGKSVTIDLNGHDLICSTAGQDVFQVWGDLVINGDGEVIANGSGSNYAVWALGTSKVVLNGGTYKGNGATIQAKESAQIEINGGYYSVMAPYNGTYFVLNLQDNNSNTIVVKGGQFENFNPAEAHTEPVGPYNFVADGYVSEKISDDPVVYEVTKNLKPEVDSEGQLLVSSGEVLAYTINKMLTSAESDQTIVLTADIDMTGIDYQHSPLGYVGPHLTNAVTIKGEGKTISNLNATGLQATLLPWSGSAITIEDLNIKDSSFIGNASTNSYSCAAVFGAFCDGSPVIIKNCTIDNVTVGNAKYVGGLVAYASGQSTFENCVIKNSEIKNSINGRTGGIGGLLQNGYIAGCGVENVTFDVFNANRTGIFVGVANVTFSFGSDNWVKGNSGIPATNYIGSADSVTVDTSGIEVR